MRTLTVSSPTPIRLNKYLADAGIVSRREADRLIEARNVSVNGKVVTLGHKVSNKDSISISLPHKALTYALYHKPRGEVTGAIPSLPGCLPVGRLDKESEGLLLYTNDFRVTEALLHPDNKREKEYLVMVREKATPRVERLLLSGISTQEATYAPVKHVHIHADGHSISITITEGKKHEIRRMLNALNLTVLLLRRVRIMSFKLHGVGKGSVHTLSEAQQKRLLTELDITL